MQTLLQLHAIGGMHEAVRSERIAALFVLLSNCGRVGYASRADASSDAVSNASETSFDSALFDASLDSRDEERSDTVLSDRTLDTTPDAMLRDVPFDTRPQNSLEVNISSFPANCPLFLEGEARCVEGELRLTTLEEPTASAVWIPTPVYWTPAQSFVVEFRFRVIVPTPTPAGGIGDGFMFVAHSDPRGSTARGARGGALGYAGSDQDAGVIGIAPSFGVEFDLYRNNWDSLNAHHVAINAGGRVDQPLDIASAGFSFSERTTYAWIVYEGSGTRLEAYVSQNSMRPNTPTVSSRLNARAVLGSPVWFGWTAGTGDARARVVIESFRISIP